MRARLDPRSKLLILILLNIVVFASANLRMELVCIGAISLLLAVMGAYRQAFWGLFLYGAMMVALYLAGLLPGFLSATIIMIVACFRKIMPTVIFASGLIATTKVSELVCALQKARFPKSIVIPFAVTLRFFPTAKEEFSCIKDAMKLRGIGLGTRNIMTRPLAVMEYVFVPIMLRSANIAEELSAAAVTRGIDSPNRRTSITELRFHLADGMALSAFSALAVLSVLLGAEVLTW